MAGGVAEAWVDDNGRIHPVHMLIGAGTGAFGGSANAGVSAATGDESAGQVADFVGSHAAGALADTSQTKNADGGGCGN